MKLRPYQSELVTEGRSAFQRGAHRVLLQLPTGGGKTVILSELASKSIQRRLSCIVIAHRKEIVQQIADKLTIFGLCPSVIAAGTPTSDLATPYIAVAMVQTLSRRLSSTPTPNLIIVDECHHMPAGQYQAIVEHWPDAKVVGLTATPSRLDGKPLSDCFDELVLGPTTRELIDLQALADYTYLAPPFDPAILKGVKKVGGDYAKGQLEEAVTKKHIIGDAIEHYRQYFNGQPVLAFCVSVDHAQRVADEFTAHGFRSESVDGRMKADQRNDIIDRFRRGLISVLTSCDLIGEGFDVPDCAGVLLMRPTASLTIYLQQVGRALRPKSDGSRAVILDHVGNCYKHGRPDDLRDWSLEAKLPQQEVTISQCPQCHLVFTPGGDRSCPETVCHYDNADSEGREVVIERVNGKLVEYIEPEHVEWCDVDVKSAIGPDYARLLRAAGDDRAKLEQIAKIRGYNQRWVHVRIEQYRRRRVKYGG